MDSQLDLFLKKSAQSPLPVVENLRTYLEQESQGCQKCPLGFSRKPTSRPVLNDICSCSKVVVVGEGPGAVEDEKQRPFVGKSGQLLRKLLNKHSINPDQLYLANVVKCRPPGNRTPTNVEATICGRLLRVELSVLKPTLVIALGATAAAYLLGRKTAKMKELAGSLTKCKLEPYPDLLILYHPAAILYEEGQGEVSKAMEQHLLLHSPMIKRVLQ